MTNNLFEGSGRSRYMTYGAPFHDTRPRANTINACSPRMLPAREPLTLRVGGVSLLGQRQVKVGPVSLAG